MTCKDCIHYERCQYLARMLMDDGYSVHFDDDTIQADKMCSNFKNKVDVVEVRHGAWIDYESDEGHGPYDSKDWYRCSECGKDALGRCGDDEWYSFPRLSDYCPNCGAKMDKELNL